MKFILLFLVSLLGFGAFAQNLNRKYKTKKVAVADTIVIANVSINSSWFTVATKEGTPLDSSYYAINFSKALLKLKKNVPTDSLIVSYLKFPEFLTKTYKQLDENIIVDNTTQTNKRYTLKQSNVKKTFVPFDGLTTSGSISRGVTIGNNQNSVLNSELDLQITGKLNDNVSLRASIQDANIPLQESGFSQRLDEFDQVFIELFSKNWSVRAGDIDLENNNSFYGAFSKRVQGLSFGANLGASRQTQVFAAGALVRGQFTTSQFVGQEGNQGPYKLQGQNGELFVLIVSGSETVYANGIALERGEDKDYIIDYNAGELIFNTTFPITSEMRITVDYQFSDRNFSRIVAYGGGNYKSDVFKVGISVYSESDAKNQPLQQNLSEAQVQVLSEAGDERSLMVAPSDVPETFSDNRILYRKELRDGNDIFVFSNDPDEELFRVTFTLVGANQGAYILNSTNAISNIFEYVGPLQGDYAPIIQLIAPTKLQVAVIDGSYTPTENTSVDFEFAGSKNDLNLFSTLDDANNDGFAGRLRIAQNIIKKDSVWNAKAYVNTDYIQENFRSIEILYNAEFNRDWNLEQQRGNQRVGELGRQTFLNSGITLSHYEKGRLNYQFEYLDFASGFTGSRHIASANLRLKRFLIQSNSSFLNATSATNTSVFLRSHHTGVYGFKNSWLGAKFSIEDNEQIDTATNILTPLSQRFASYEGFIGIGDSTKVFAQFGYKNRVNDSIRNNQLQNVNTSNTFYVDSRLIQNKNTTLSLYANFRTLDFEDPEIANENALNSRLQFNQKLFKNIIQSNTVFETNSGALPQQDFTFVEVEAGQGTFTWNDYNGNGIQELEEFETAQFQDQGLYIRVLLPNQVFIKTHQNRLSQTLTINPAKWNVSKQKSKKFWSHFYNQSSYLIDRRIRQDGSNFNLNPFESDAENQLDLQLNFRNVLFFNRGKQRYTTSYTFLSNASNNTLSVGLLQNDLNSHQVNFNHKLHENWLLTLQSALGTNESSSENFTTKNFKFDEALVNPKLSYLFNENSRFDLFYQYTTRENTIGNFESLIQQNVGLGFNFAKNEKAAINGEVNYFNNAFNGDPNTPVGFQLLEGLQPGNNFTWTLLAQKKLTKFLDLNLSYFGRKTETGTTIHTGNVQLKAYF